MEQKRIDYYRKNPDHVFSRTITELLDEAEAYEKAREGVDELLTIAYLIGSIFYYGDFRIETPNEGHLAYLLNKHGFLFESEDEVIQCPVRKEATSEIRDWWMQKRKQQAAQFHTTNDASADTPTPKHAHFICPVRNVTDEQQQEIDLQAYPLEVLGWTVHNPKYATDQNDPTGYNICMDHLESMKKADMIYLFWDINSKGSHFDLGMAFALGKPLTLVTLYQNDDHNKSYVKVINEVIRRQKESE